MSENQSAEKETYDSRVKWENLNLYRQLKFLSIIPRLLGLAPYRVTKGRLQPYSTITSIYTALWITFYVVMLHIVITYVTYPDPIVTKFRKLTSIVTVVTAIINVLWAFLERNQFVEVWHFVNEYDRLTKYHLREKWFSKKLWCIVYFIAIFWIYPIVLQVSRMSLTIQTVAEVLSIVTDFTVVIGMCKFAIEVLLIGLRIRDFNNIILSGSIHNYARGPFLTFREIRHLYVILISTIENLGDSHKPQLFAWMSCSFCSTIIQMYNLLRNKFDVTEKLTTRLLAIVTVQITITYIFCKICEFNITEANRIIISLYSKQREPTFSLIVGKEKFETELYMILMRPRFSALELFDIDSSLFCGMVTESVTYLVLLLQQT